MKTLFATSLLSMVALAAATDAGVAKPNAGKPAGDAAPAPIAETAEAKKARESLNVAAIRTDIPIPDRKARRGSTSKYDFDKLQVGQSIGVIGKTARELSSVVGNLNRKFKTEKKDDAGAIVYKMTEIKDANGTVTGHKNTGKAEMVKTRDYIVEDVDPANDPDKATARVFRVA